MAQISGKRVLHVKRRYILPFLGLACRLGLFPEGGVEWLRVALDGPMSMSAEKARRELGWVPRFDSAETYLEYLKSLKGKR
jgi:nucleoside-diphosphate-sugar epimerase